jgi:DHA3 family macrolide efflux protein-like MFS transporter
MNSMAEIAATPQVGVEPRGMKTFFLIWAGELISMIGSGMTAFALGVWIYQQTGRATPFALVAFGSQLPRILLSPVAGTLVDRWDRRKVMILADTGSALLTLGVAIMLTFSNLQIWHIFTMVILSSCFSAFQEPAYTASITMLVPKKELGRASGLVQTGQSLETLLSPVLAGILFVAVGLPGIIMIDFITFFFAVGALLVVRIPQPEYVASEQSGARATVLQDAIFGLKYLLARTGLLGLLIYFALVNFFLNISVVLSGPLVLSFSTAAGLGIVQTASGAGMLIGSILLSAWGGPKRRVPGIIGFILLGSCGLLLMGLRPSVVVIAAGFFLLLFSIPLASGPSQALFQSKVAPGVQGRVFAIRMMISRSMMPLAFLLAGPLSDKIFEPLMQSGGRLTQIGLGNLLGAGPGRGTGLIFIIAATILILASLGAFMYKPIRNLEDDLPDAID